MGICHPAAVVPAFDWGKPKLQERLHADLPRNSPLFLVHFPLEMCTVPRDMQHQGSDSIWRIIMATLLIVLQSVSLAMQEISTDDVFKNFAGRRERPR